MSSKEHFSQTIYPIEPPIIKVLDSGVSGPHITIIGGMHGDEPSPVRFLENVLDGQEKLGLDRGSLSIVLANPTAYKLGARAVNVNLNTILTTSESETGPQPEFKSARLIMDLLDKSDACLDLHEHKDIGLGQVAMASVLSSHVATSLGADLFVHGLETIEPGASDAYMYEIGKIGVCLELGHHQDDNTAVARNVIHRFLSLTGVLDSSIPPVPRPLVAKARELIIRESDQFSYAPHVKSGTQLQQGPFAWDGQKELHASDTSMGVLFPRPNNPIGASVGILVDFKDGIS